jgi:3-phosphoshikimate 1-carboxyvinyltransferase
MDTLKKLGPADFNVFKGDIKICSSKSLANRALLIQALSSYSFMISNLNDSDDVRIMEEALKSKSHEIDLGMAGTAMRFLSAGFSILKGKRILKGDPRLHDRPIKALVEALKKLGAKISYLEADGKLPIAIEGTDLIGGDIMIEQDQSSQFVSALMLIAPFLKKGLSIKRPEIKRSESYIQLTKDLMEDLGFALSVSEDEIIIPPAKPSVKHYEVEGDWSAAAYILSLIILIPNSTVSIHGLHEESAQGDKEILLVLKKLGLEFQWMDNILIAKNDESIKIPNKLAVDCTNMPDQAQTIAFLCAALGVEAELSGLETLSFKETNRIQAISIELQKAGLKIESSMNSISIKGRISHEELIISTYNDHRMAMSATLLATKINVKIENPDVVSKSYPNFWNDLEKLTSES